jgi:hypothetical protein
LRAQNVANFGNDRGAAGFIARCVENCGAKNEKQG